ncbi:TOMM precursor leader peptide-binding protein [Streptomyces sp. NPDC053367]|uniref:TOMM precursor leader peptide-binding protein n=1 Tax=Streptomyces sp. NPDC053367 TaxID=3365700 RepID=UPI0037D72B1D
MLKSVTIDNGRPLGLRAHLRAEVVPGEAVYLLSARHTLALRGPHLEALVPLLDGTRTLTDVLGEAADTVPPAQAGRLIGELARAGVIGYRSLAGETADRAAEAYWELAGLDGASAEKSLAGSPVELVTVGRVDTAGVRAACRASGLVLADEAGASGPGTLSLVLCDDYLHPDLAAVDARHRREGRPWLLARPCGTEPWVGPVFGVDDGPCWHCLAHRLRLHRGSERPLQRALGEAGPLARPPASLAAGRALALNTTVLEVAKWLAGVRHEGQSAVCVLDTFTLRAEHHGVRRRPQCAECGDPALVARRAGRPPRLRARPKAAHGGSNDRALTPEQMLDRYGHLIGPVTGVVPEVRPDTRLPDGLDCWLSGRNLALAGQSLDELRGSLRSLSGGKGTSALEARVSALCEAVERYSGTRQGDEPVVVDTLNGLGAQALEPNSCQLFADWQFAERERWNATHSAFHRVCAPFDAGRPVEWTPVWSLTGGGQRLLPTSMLYFHPSSRFDPRGPWADSNGNAAGSSLEDAILQGFLELVERDAVALWWYNRTRHPGVDLDAFDEPWLARTRGAYARMHREMWVLDLTSDLGVPAIAAVSRRTDKAAEDITFGFGAHFDPRLALRRAVTEMTQMLPAVAGVRADGTGYVPSAARDLLDWWTRATVRNQPHLLPDSAESATAPSRYGYSPRADLAADLTAVKELVTARGMELFVLDQTRPDLNLPVVKVLVPGLRHFWARFAPGRLFDVPVRLGRISQPLGVHELNPIPLFA